MACGAGPHGGGSQEQSNHSVPAGAMLCGNERLGGDLWFWWADVVGLFEPWPGAACCTGELADGSLSC